MDNGKRLKEETRIKLRDYTVNAEPELKNLRHRISDDGEKVLITGDGQKPNPKSIMNDADNIEKILHAKYETYVNLGNTITLIFQVKDKNIIREDN